MTGLNDGVENEKQIVSALNEKKYKRLTEYQKKFISQINPNVSEDTTIKAKKIGRMGFKPDVEISVGDEKSNISIKKGGGNSVHQEKTEYFLYYCIHFLGMTEEEKNSLLLFLYGDGTINGDSLPEERLRNEELVTTYFSEINQVQLFLNRNKRNLIERFLIDGRNGKQNNIRADYLYHGDAKSGVWCPLNDDAIDYIVSLPNKEDAPLSIGPLTLQVWNRNLEAKPEFEDRRHSIQVKWGSCKANIKQINTICNEMERKNETKRQGLDKNNSHGFKNQKKLLMLLDGHRVGKLSSVLKELIKEMYPYVANSDLVYAKKINDEGIKPRISICINDEVKYLSIFMGSGNSVHQENIKTFIPYCKLELDMSMDEEMAFMKILYGDGTIDGDSVAEERLSEIQIKEKYIDEINIVQAFLDRNKKSLVERFLIYGKNGKDNNIKVDFIYYGTDVTGRGNSYHDVVDFVLNQENSSSALLSIGALTIQTWNRNLQTKSQYEYKRESIQIKWGSMKKYFNEIREISNVNKHGSNDGNWEEYELVGKLNRNRKANSRLWGTIVNKLNINNLEDVYAVKVSKTIYSELAKRNVLPKADVYLTKGKLPRKVLLENNYWLDEDILQNYYLEFIDNSGISCKSPNSMNFTYAKLSIHSFTQLFRDNLLGVGISLFVKKSDLYLNNTIVEAWSGSEQLLIDEWKDEIKKKNIIESEIMLTNAEVCKIIKFGSIDKAKRMIIEEQKISDAIFKGKGVFKEPYTATFTYINDDIKVAHRPVFSITTGSGRHKGIYTIVVKP